MTTTIDITPTWAGITPTLLRLLEDPGISEKVKRPVRDELLRMAKLADQLVEQEKRNGPL